MKRDDLNASVRRGMRLVNAQVIAAKVSVVRKLDPHLPTGENGSGQNRASFINLFINALQAMSPGGVLTVTTRSGQFGENLKVPEAAFRQISRGERVVVAEVQDTGTGIAAANLPKVFDPFFTTKPVGRGPGWDFRWLRRLSDFHGGGVDIQTSRKAEWW